MDIDGSDMKEVVGTDEENGEIFEFGVIDSNKVDKPSELEIEKQDSQKVFDQLVAFVKSNENLDNSGSVSIESAIGGSV